MNYCNMVAGLGLVTVLFTSLLVPASCKDDIQLQSYGQNGYKVTVVYYGYRLEFPVHRPSELDNNNFGVWESSQKILTRVDNKIMSGGELFEDEVSGTSIIIQQQQFGTFSIQGTLGDSLYVLPTNSAPIFPTTNSSCITCLPLTEHTISPQTPSNLVDGDDFEYLDESTLDKKEFMRARRGKALPYSVYPEVLVLVDYALYSKNSYDTSKTRNYVASFMNGVNLRFRSFGTPSINLNIAGIIIEKSSGSFSFLNRNKLSGGRLEAPGALHNMGTHFYSQEGQYPEYDMVLLLTGLDMARVRSGRLSSSTSGYAYVGGACVKNRSLRKISSVGIVEDSGGYSGIIVAAHEIGHLLGAVHDGDSSPSYLSGPGARLCPWSDGYIMSDRRSSTRGVQWSRCSQKQIIYFLNTNAAQCLQNKPRSIQYYLDETNPPGQSMTLDYQCFRDKGTRACFKGSGVCTQLFCYQPGSRSCLSYRPAAEGSDCGDGNWCINAKCTKKTTVNNPFNSNSLVKKSLSIDTRSGSISNNFNSNRFTNSNQPLTNSRTPVKTFTTQTFTRSNPVQKTNNDIQPTKTVIDNGVTTYYYPPNTNVNSINTPAPETVRRSFNTNPKSTFTTRSRISTTNSKSSFSFSVKPSSSSSQCIDNYSQQGLSCPALFQRYAFKNCSSRFAQKNCCVSYNKYCKS